MHTIELASYTGRLTPDLLTLFDGSGVRHWRAHDRLDLQEGEHKKVDAVFWFKFPS